MSLKFLLINLAHAVASITLSEDFDKNKKPACEFSVAQEFSTALQEFVKDLKCFGTFRFHHDFKTFQTLQISSAPYNGFILFAFVHQLQTSQTNKIQNDINSTFSQYTLALKWFSSITPPLPSKFSLIYPTLTRQIDSPSFNIQSEM